MAVSDGSHCTWPNVTVALSIVVVAAVVVSIKNPTVTGAWSFVVAIARVVGDHALTAADGWKRRRGGGSRRTCRCLPDGVGWVVRNDLAITAILSVVTADIGDPVESGFAAARLVCGRVGLTVAGRKVGGWSISGFSELAVGDGSYSSWPDVAVSVLVVVVAAVVVSVLNPAVSGARSLVVAVGWVVGDHT